MKPLFFYTLFLLSVKVLLPADMHAQSFKKRKALSKQFLKKVRVREVLDTMLWDKESAIFNQTEKWFKERKLNVYNREDYEFFQSSLMHQFLFSKRHILNRISYHYSHVPYDTLKNYVEQIDKGKRQEVIISSGLYDRLKKMLHKELKQIRNVTVPKYLEYLVNKHKPVDIKITYNNKSVPASKLNLDILVETNNVDYKRVSILDKKHNKILKPEGYTYQQIQKIIVKFKGRKFEFKPDEHIDFYPRQFKELNSVISKYSYNKIPVWHLDILESGGNIGVKLTNVIEVKAVKGKTVQKSKNIKRID